MAWDIKDAELCLPACRTLFADEEDPGSSKYLAHHLQLRVADWTPGLIRDRIGVIRMVVKLRHPQLPYGHSDDYPRLLVDRSCVNLIREMEAYRYPDNKREQDRNAPENPLKKDDHTPEALGRFYMGHYGVGSLTKRETVISTARMGR